MALPNIINSPAAPRKLTYSCSGTLSKKEARKMRLLLYPLTRPAQVPAKKKVSWRLTKKWFNRYEKPGFIGRIVIAEAKDGSRYQMQITDVRISKGGGRKRNYNFQCQPV